MVGEELQGGVLVRAGWARSGAQELGRVAKRQASGAEGPLSAVQAQARRAGHVPVHYRGAPRRAGPPSRHPAAAWENQDHESTRKLARRVEAGTARVLS